MDAMYEKLWLLESRWPFSVVGHAGRLTLQLRGEDVAEDSAGEQHHEDMSQGRMNRRRESESWSVKVDRCEMRDTGVRRILLRAAEIDFRLCNLILEPR